MRAAFLLAVALAVLAVLHTPLLGASLANAAQPVGEFDGTTVLAVDFVADEPVDERSLREYLPLKAGDILSQEALDRAVQYLEWKDVWSSIAADLRGEENGVRLVFLLEIKRTVNLVKVSGYDTFYAEDLVRRIRIPSGSTLRAAAVAEAADRLREYYRRRGFPDARVAVEETHVGHRQVNLDFQIEEGQAVLISAVLLEGALAFPPEDILRGLSAQAGGRFTIGLDRTVRREVQTFYRDRNYFDAQVSVEWQVDASDDTRGDLFVVVAPGVEHEIRFQGNEAFSRRHLLALIDLGRRPVITDATWRELERRIALTYRLSGYYKAHVGLVLEEENGKRVILYKIEEGPRYWIRTVEFVGNDEVPAAKLEEVMRTRPATWLPFSSAGTLDNAILADDLRKIWFLYRTYGFESAQVVDSRVSFDNANDALDLVIEIDEGPLSVVRGLEFTGFEDVPALPTLQTQQGQPYNPYDAEHDTAALAVAVSRVGYPQSHVRSEVEAVRTGAVVETTVRFIAEPGSFREFGPIVVRNNLITKDRVIVRELPMEEGDPYDPLKLGQAQANIYRLGLFRRVTVEPLDPPDVEAPTIGVTVDERPAGTASYGFGYETDIGVRVFGEVGYDNLAGMNRRLSLRADVSVEPTDPSDSQYVGNLGYRVPRPFDTYLTSRTNFVLLRNTLSLNRYSLEGFTMAQALDREIARGFVVSGIVEWDQADTFDVNADANLASEGVKDVGFLRQVSFGPALEFDRRDDPFAPRSGTVETFRMRYAAKALNSDIRFLSLVAKHAQYIPLTEDLTFVYAVRGAWALPLDGKFTVPIRDRYFTGGRTSVRGFEENSVAPLGADGSPIGGDIMVNGNAELRFPLVFGFDGAVFFDSGGTFLRKECTTTVCNFSKIDLDDIRRSVGLGLRYITPVGPISLQYGFKLDRRSGESIGAFHFTIGNIF